MSFFKYTLIICLGLFISFAFGFDFNIDFNLQTLIPIDQSLIIPSSATKDTIPYPLIETTDNSMSDTSSTNNLQLKDPDIIIKQIEYDAETGGYMLQEKIGNDFYKNPQYLTFEEYLDLQKKKSQDAFWKSRANADNVIEGDGTKPKLYSGPELFDRVFGGGTVDIRPAGNVDITLGGTWQNIQNPQLLERQRKTGNLDFDMNINLNVMGKIGEKLKLQTTYNTLATFNFENQVKLEYTGNEDEIIQKLEAGNVSMPLKSTLIQGSQTLMGFKTQLKFGKLSVTTLLSQQQSKSENIKVEGGAQIKNFEIMADQYEENKHFFLGQYFAKGNPITGKEGFENALKNPPAVNSLFQITKLEVWVTNTRNVAENTREIVAFSDLGEYQPYSNQLLPSVDVLPSFKSNNLYSKLIAQGANTRDISSVISTLTGPAFNLQAVQDFEKTRMFKLNEQEYSFNPRLGILSLNTQLKPAEVLGVSYQYSYNGQVYQVGEFSQDVASDTTGNKILYVKLLKSTSIRTQLPIWDLMMKNIYSLGAYQINNDEFRLDVLFLDPGGGEKRYIPEGTGVQGIPLISLLGLDKLNVQNDPDPDGVFDFNPLTINTNNGRMMFPVLEPFGSSLRNKFSVAQPDLANKYTYDSLYRSTKTMALQFPEKNRYKIKGTYRSSVSNEISLGAFNVPKNSVKVTAGGRLLQENIDYTIDYNLGRVRILNDGILNSGVAINVNYEDPALIGFQVRRLLGTRLDYNHSKNLFLGATYMQLSERPFTQKVNIGDDPINNRIIGIDGSFNNELPTLTRWVDKLPFYSTKEQSTINLNGEAAKFIPGHSKLIGKEGQVYLDDFEGSATEYDLRFPINAWVQASTPFNAIDPQGFEMFPEARFIDSIGGNINRAKLSNYNIDPIFTSNNSSTPNNIKDNKAEQENPYVRMYQEIDIFPNRSSQLGQQTQLSTFDLGYYPKQRGPYNFDYTNVNADGSLKNPKDRWGGIMRAIDYNDFENANVQFMSFWLLDPFILNQDTGDIYINLGSISEDVIKDSRQSFENALPKNGDINKVDTTNIGVVAKYPPITSNFDTDPSSREVQDVGLDGCNNTVEKSKFNNFITAIAPVLNPSALSTLQADPCSDDYHHYRGDDYDTQELGVLSRYKKVNGSENNSPVISSNQTFINSSSQLPDIEDLNRDFTLNENEEYFQYRIHMEPNMQVGSNFITEKVSFNRPHNGVNREVTFYHFVIPIDQYEHKVGGIQDFRSIRFVRMFLTNFKDSVTCRFARMDLIRNQWRNYNFSLLNPGEYLPDDTNDATYFNTGAVNFEENYNRTPIPYVLPPGIIRELNAGAANTTIQQNEQSLSLKACNLKDGDSRGVFKTINLDLRNFKRMRMFIHAEELSGSNSPINDGEVHAFIRIGSDFVNNYYEYEIPLKITDPTTLPELIWPVSNQLDLLIDSLSSLKLLRNSTNKPFALPYSIVNASGHKMTVIGNPELGRASAIMLGIRNPKNDGTRPDDGLPKCAELWFNELRMSGFDEKGGYAAIARADIKLADLGSINLSGNMHTQGFGALDQRIQNRFRDNFYSYDASASIDLSKFLPKKSRIKLPIYAGIQRSVSSPQFDPFDSDIELKDKIDAVRAKQGKAAGDSIRRIAQVRQTVKSFNLTNVRRDRKPDAKPKIYDIENINVSYSYQQLDRSNPQIASDKMEHHKAGIGYNYSLKTKYIEPFRKLIKSENKFLKPIKEINFNFKPSELSFRNDFDRDLGTLELRKLSPDPLPNPKTFIKSFTWTRAYNVRFDLTKSLKLDFNATNQSRIDERKGRPQKGVLLDTLKFDAEPWGRSTLYNQTVNASYSLPIDKIPYLDWFKVKAQYGTNFGWIGASRTQEALSLKNTVTNSQNKQLNGDFDIKKIYENFAFLKEYNKSQFPSAAKKETKAGGKNAVDPEGANPKNDPKNMLKNGTDKDSKSLKDQKGNKAGGKNIDPTAKGATDEQLGADSKNALKNKKKIIVATPLLAALIKPLISLKKVNFNYSETGATTLPGYNYRSKYFGLNPYNDIAPTANFAFGDQNENDYQEFLQAAAEKGWITRDTMLNTLFTKQRTRTFTLKSNFELYYDLKLDLNFSKQYTNDYNELFKIKNGRFQHLTPNERGNWSISYYSLGTMFEKVGENNSSATFKRFENNRTTIIKRLKDANPYYANSSNDTFQNINHYGIYQQDVLLPSFIAAYSNKDASKVKMDIFSYIPRPNWRLTYTGLSNIPALKDIVQSINISHAYTNTMSVGSFASNLYYVDTLDVYAFNYDTLNGNFFPRYNIPMLSINEQLSPLLGIDVAFKKPRMTAKIEYKMGRTLGLSLIDYQLIESRNKELTVGVGYKVKGLNLRFIKVKGKPLVLENDLNFRFDFSIRDNQTTNRKLDQEVNDITRGSTVYRIAPSLDYMINSKLNARLFYDRTFNNPKIANSFPMTNTRAGLTIRFTLGS